MGFTIEWFSMQTFAHARSRTIYKIHGTEKYLIFSKYSQYLPKYCCNIHFFRYLQMDTSNKKIEEILTLIKKTGISRNILFDPKITRVCEKYDLKCKYFQKHFLFIYAAAFIYIFYYLCTFIQLDNEVS